MRPLLNDRSTGGVTRSAWGLGSIWFVSSRGPELSLSGATRSGNSAPPAIIEMPMSAGPLPNPPNERLKSAAEELLGIDLSTPPIDPESIDLDDDDLFAEPTAGEEPPPESAAAAREETALPVTADAGDLDDDEDEFGSDFGAGLDAGDESLLPIDTEAEAEAEEETPESVPATPKDDRYWDALEGWDWEEEGGESRRGRAREPRETKERKAEPPERRRPERAVAPPRREREVPREIEDDFGSGLLEPEAPPPRERAVRPVIEPTRGEVGEARPKREPPPRGERELPHETPPPRPVPPAGMEEEDEFGAGLDVEPVEKVPPSAAAPEPSERESGRGRRRRGRGRGREVSRAGEPAPMERATEEPELAEVPLSEAEAEFESVDMRFRDVPTWAEAVALLVKGRGRTSESGGGERGRSRGGSSADEPSGERRPGRPGRRGRGSR